MLLTTDYRPTTFDEVAAFKSVKKLLNKKQFSHVWLFIGNNNIGKTTLPRIVAEKIDVSEAILLESVGDVFFCGMSA